MKTTRPRTRISRRTIRTIAWSAATTLVATAGTWAAGNVAATTDDDTRTVETVMGDVEIPADPQRIVSVDYRASLQVLDELGAPLIGTQTRTDGVWSELSDNAAQLPSVWVRGEEIDLEAIVALDPDLIVGAQGDNEDLYEQLSAIAPTVLIGNEGTWLDTFRYIADIANRTDQADELLAAIDAQVNDLEAAIAQRWPDGVRVTLLRIRDDIRSTQVADRNNRSGPWLLNQIDVLTVTGDERNVESDGLSPEQLREADGDVILYFGGGGGSDATQDQEFLLNVIDNPLWDDLSAVQDRRAFNVDSDIWFDGSGITAFELAIADLTHYVAQAPG